MLELMEGALKWSSGVKLRAKAQGGARGGAQDGAQGLGSGICAIMV